MAMLCIPTRRLRKQHRETSRKTILLAEKLGVPVMVDFSGCPGDSPNAIAPNWITCPWPPDFRKVLDWQWNEVVAPYWMEHAKFAADHGVKIAVEMHPGFVVYNPETMLKLRSIAGNNVGCNYDPSHLVLAADRSDRRYPRARRTPFSTSMPRTRSFISENLLRTGVLDTKPYTEERDRTWIFRTCGYGHGAEWWSEFISTLRMFGYDSVISIEHEDSLMSPERRLDQGGSFPEQHCDPRKACGGVVVLSRERIRGERKDENNQNCNSWHRIYGARAPGSGAASRSRGSRGYFWPE